MGIASLGTIIFLLLYLGCYLLGTQYGGADEGGRGCRGFLEIGLPGSVTRRRVEATKSPLDERYYEAMQLLAALAATVDQIEPSLLAAYAELWEGPVESEAHAELLREVGFSFWPSTAAEFVSRFISKLTG
jgi:hypothetical protein